MYDGCEKNAVNLKTLQNTNRPNSSQLTIIIEKFMLKAFIRYICLGVTDSYSLRGNVYKCYRPTKSCFGKQAIRLKCEVYSKPGNNRIVLRRRSIEKFRGQSV